MDLPARCTHYCFPMQGFLVQLSKVLHAWRICEGVKCSANRLVTVRQFRAEVPANVGHSSLGVYSFVNGAFGSVAYKAERLLIVYFKPYAFRYQSKTTRELGGNLQTRYTLS